MYLYNVSKLFNMAVDIENAISIVTISTVEILDIVNLISVFACE